MTFYQEVLGFGLRRRPLLRREAELQHLDTIVTLWEADDRRQVTALLHLAFEVESIAEATSFLEGRGLIVRRTRACRGTGSQIWITDPDGHMVILFETETNDLAQGC